MYSLSGSERLKNADCPSSFAFLNFGISSFLRFTILLVGLPVFLDPFLSASLPLKFSTLCQNIAETER